MPTEVWVATRDIDEPNLKVKQGRPLPDRFQSNYVVRKQLMPFLGEGSFELQSPNANDQEAVVEKLDRIVASVERLHERIEKLEGASPTRVRGKSEG